MNTKLKCLAALGGFAALCAGIAPWTLSDAALRREISRQASEATGFNASMRGRAVFALLPRPRLKLENISARSPDGAVSIEADMLRGDLRILPMFAGRLELANATLISPKIDIDLNRLATSDGAGAAKPATQDPARLGSLAVVDGAARLHDDARSATTQFDHLDMTLDWQGASSPVTMRGAFNWLDHRVDAALWIGKPSEALAGRPTPLVAKFDSPDGSIALDGTAWGGQTPSYAGKLQATAPSAGALAKYIPGWAHIDGLDNIALSGVAKMDAKGLALNDARLDVLGARFDGALTVSTAGLRPLISGTLATETINLGPLLAAAQPLTTREGDWNEAPFPVVDFAALDVDLRLSATRAQLGRLVADGVGLSVLSNDGRLTASLIDAKAFGGEIKGSMSLSGAPEGYALRAQGALTGVDMASMLFSPRQTPRVSGEGYGGFSIESAGDSMAAMVRGLAGQSTLELRGGGIGGLDLEQALRRIERRPLSIASELRGGKTAFKTATFAISFDKGMATIERADGASAGVAFRLSGSANLPQRAVALQLRAWAASQTAQAENPAGLAMTIKGPWDGPALGLDTQDLIKRSSAAAPLWGAATPPAADPATAAQAQ